jgi:hypothetical protein
METKNYLILLTAFFVFQWSEAADVIDLGTLSIDGELRQPQIQSYRLPKPTEDAIQLVSQETFELFEELLLQKVELNISADAGGELDQSL